MDIYIYPQKLFYNIIFIKNGALPGTCSGGTKTDSHAKHTKIDDGTYVCTR